MDNYHRYIVTVRMRKPLLVIPYPNIVARDDDAAIKAAKKQCKSRILRDDGEWTARQEADPLPEREPADWM